VEPKRRGKGVDPRMEDKETLVDVSGRLYILTLKKRSLSSAKTTVNTVATVR